MVSHDTFNRLWKQTSFRVIDLTTNFYYKCSLCQKKRIWPSWKEKINKIVLGCCCILGKCPEQRPTHWRHGHIIDMNSFQSLQSSIKWSGLLLTCISIKRMMDFERKKDIFKASQCMHSGLKKFFKEKIHFVLNFSGIVQETDPEELETLIEATNTFPNYCPTPIKDSHISFIWYIAKIVLA